MLIIDIETSELQTLNKKAGGTYQLQLAYAHLVGRDGQPERYPREIKIFPSRAPSGNPVAYPPGQYRLSPRSFSVNNGRLELGFASLDPVKK